MLLRCLAAAGNEPTSLVSLAQLDSTGAVVGEPVELPLWLLASAFEHMPDFQGFTADTTFDVRVQAVAIVVQEVPITDGAQLLSGTTPLSPPPPPPANYA